MLDYNEFSRTSFIEQIYVSQVESHKRIYLQEGRQHVYRL